MSTLFGLTTDINGYNGFGLLPSDDKWSATLTSGSATSFTVPSNYKNWIAIFSYGINGDCWVSVNHTAASPSGATLATTNSDLNPTALQIKSGDIISLLTDNASLNVGVKLYAL